MAVVNRRDLLSGAGKVAATFLVSETSGRAATAFLTGDEMNKRQHLTIVHAFSQNHKVFLLQKEFFERKYDVVLPDLLGHGANTDYHGAFGFEEYASDILRLLDRMRIDSTIYWGTHTGAAVGLTLAAHFPDRITSLILEGAVIPGMTMPRVVSRFARAREMAASEGVKAALQDWFDNAEWFSVIRSDPKRYRSEEQKAIILEFPGEPLITRLSPRPVTPLIDKLREIRQPTLVYNGSKDLTEFRDAAAVLERGLPHVKRVELPGLGGFPSWEDPVRVNALVEDFLGSIRKS